MLRPRHRLQLLRLRATRWWRHVARRSPPVRVLKRCAEALVAGFVLLVIVSGRVLPGSDAYGLSYLLRPLWDRDRYRPLVRAGVNRAFKHGGKPVQWWYGAQQSCATLTERWPKRTTPSTADRDRTAAAKPAKVFDTFLFGTNLDMLYVRLVELAPVVDKFILFESTTSFAGRTKPLIFAENRHRFAAFADKIIAVGYDESAYAAGNDLSKRTKAIASLFARNGCAPVGFFEMEGTSPRETAHLRRRQKRSDKSLGWCREVAARAALSHELRALASAGDVVLHSDVDEIPRRAVVAKLRECAPALPPALGLLLQPYRYSFEFRLENPSIGQFVWVVPGLGSHAHVAPSPLTKISKHTVLKQAHGFLAGAGWHCSWCFRSAGEVVWKLNNYNHWDRKHSVGAWGSTSVAALEARMCDGSDPFGMLPEAFTFADLVAEARGPARVFSVADLPQAVVEAAASTATEREDDGGPFFDVSFLVPGRRCRRDEENEGS